VGAVAEKTDAVSGTATIDAGFGPVTLGRITMGGLSNNAFGVTPTAGLTLDQDGAGGSPAIISNTNTSGGTSPAVILNAGTVTLADDLLISNTSNSARTSGAIIISSTLTGTPGSVTIESVGNAFPLSTGSFAGAVRIQTGVNTFMSNVLVRKGLVTFNNNNSFGDAANVITLGEAGQGSVTVVSTAAALVPQSIIVADTSAPGDYNGDGIVNSADYVLWRKDPLTYGGDPAGYNVWRANFGSISGTTILGSVSTSNTTTALGYSGDILLNGDLTTTGASLVGTGPNFSGDISGVGGITHFGNAAGGLLGNATLSGTNTYAGTTTINSGSLQFAQQVSLYNGVMANWTDTNLIVNASGVASFYVGGTGEFTASDIDHLKGLGTASGGFKNGSGLGFNTTNAAGGVFSYSSNISNTNAGANALGLVKYGTNTLNLSGTNDYTGITVVAQGTLQFAKQVSLYNNTPASWTATNLTVNAGTTAAFNVGGAGEFTASDIDTIKGLGTATGGFLGTDVAAATASNLGFDTTNAGGTFVYSSNIANPNGGANPMGITKIGTGTLELTGNSTYTGSTIVDGGTLRLNGGSHVINPTATVTNTIGNYNIGSVAGTTGELIIDGANITSDNGMMVGQNGTGTMTLNSGTVILKNDNAGGEQFLGIGRFAGSSGTYTQNGGSLLVGATGTSDWFVVGRDGTAVATLNLGDIKSSTFALAQGTTGNGTFNINGGTVTTSANMYVVAGPGVINQTAGELKIGTWFTLGEAATASATYNISGGTMSTGNVAAENFVVAFGGTAVVNQTGGDITVRGDWNLGWTGTGNGTHNISNGTLTVITNNMFAGIDGIAVVNQSGGTITVPQFSAFGRGVTGQGTYNMSGGTSDWGSDLNIGDFGKGFLNQTGGTINAFAPIFGWRDVSEGTGTINGASAVLNATGTGGLFIGLFGKGTLELQEGQINVTNASGDFTIGDQAVATSNGTFNQTGGAVVVSDQSYVGDFGTGAYNMSGGTFSAGDNLWIGLNAIANGTLTQTGGTITVVGNDPTYTGNVVMGRLGVGTLNMQGGTLDLVVSGYPSVNSLSFSILNTGVGNLYALAQDGNLMIGERTGSATVNQSAGLIKVAANVFVGSINVLDSAFDGSSAGTLTITGGEMRVGVTSLSGGDMVIGGSGISNLATGTVSLQGGTLDVSNGSGKIGAALGTSSFTFTGGTLKVKEYNAPDFGGNLGNLVQNGTGSLLDVTGNDTIIQSSYDLGEGTATVGAGRTFTVNGVLNSAGAGIINVGTGGGAATLTAGAGAVAVDTLNLNNGNVTAGAGVTVATALNGNGTFNNSVTMGTGASVSPGLSIGTLNLLDDLTLDATGTTIIEIDGNTMSDKISVSDILTLAGTLQINVIGATPTVGQAFDILDWNSLSGTFSTVPPPANWDTTDLYTMGVVKFVALGAGSGIDGGAVPEPTVLALLALAACGLLGRRSARPRS
jgi:autotransporter-associated beta strand protein